MIERRRLLTALGGMVLAPRFVRAQQTGRIYRLCWLGSGVLLSEPYNLAFLERLRELGFATGSNLAIECRSAEGRVEKLTDLAAELARVNCDVYLAPGSEVILAAIKQTSRDTAIVIVANDYDPVVAGHVASLARPGGRITGVSQLQSELPAKRLELLKELLPKAERIAVLADVSTAGQLEAVQDAAKRLGVQLQVREFTRAPYDYERAFDEFRRAGSEALLALASGYFVLARRLIPALALRHRLPSMFGNYLWAESGGLLSYGPNFSELYRRAAEQVSLILKGANPAGMPVEQASKFELVINLETAKALGLTIQPSILVRADRVID